MNQVADEQNVLMARAIELACRVHGNQKDKAGKPYIMHPLRVMDKMQGKLLKQIAVLHDVIEDSVDAVEPITPEILSSLGFSSLVIEAVVALSKKPGENYQTFIDRCATNPYALMVKIADLEDNMDVTRLAELTEKDLKRLKKYHTAYVWLKSRA